MSRFGLFTAGIETDFGGDVEGAMFTCWSRFAWRISLVTVEGARKLERNTDGCDCDGRGGACEAGDENAAAL